MIFLVFKIQENNSLNHLNEPSSLIYSSIEICCILISYINFGQQGRLQLLSLILFEFKGIKQLLMLSGKNRSQLIRLNLLKILKVRLVDDPLDF